MANTVQEAIPPATLNGTVADARIHRAQARVRALRGFYIHLGIYLIINLGIFLLNWVLIQFNGPGQRLLSFTRPR